MKLPLFRWTVRGMLMAFVPICVLSGLFAFQRNVDLKIQQAVDVVNLLLRRGIDANLPSVGLKDATVTFKNANITDTDLDAFAAAFNRYAPKGLPEIRRMRLNGSPVSAEAIERFRRAVPECELQR